MSKVGESVKFRSKEEARGALADVCVRDLVTGSRDLDFKDRCVFSSFKGKYADRGMQILEALSKHDERMSRPAYEYGIQQMILLLERAPSVYLAYCANRGLTPTVEGIKGLLSRSYDAADMFMNMKNSPGKTFQTNYGLNDTTGTYQNMNMTVLDLEGGPIYTVNRDDWNVCLEEVKDLGKSLGDGPDTCAARGGFGRRLWVALIDDFSSDPGLFAEDLRIGE